MCWFYDSQCINKFLNAFCKTMLAADQVKPTDEQLIAPLYLMRISPHPAFSLLTQKMVIAGGQVGLYAGFTVKRVCFSGNL